MFRSKPLLSNRKEWQDVFLKSTRSHLAKITSFRKGIPTTKLFIRPLSAKGYFVKRVMIDDESRVDICCISTLRRMKIGIEQIWPNNVCVHAFDVVKRDIIGDIDLILTIG